MIKNKKPHVKYHIIEQASNGDEEALQAILKHYEAYTAKLSARPVYGLDGKVHMVLDEEMRGRLQSMLLGAITKFDAAAVKE